MNLFLKTFQSLLDRNMLKGCVRFYPTDFNILSLYYSKASENKAELKKNRSTDSTYQKPAMRGNDKL